MLLNVAKSIPWNVGVSVVANPSALPVIVNAPVLILIEPVVSSSLCVVVLFELTDTATVPLAFGRFTNLSAVGSTAFKKVSLVFVVEPSKIILSNLFCIHSAVIWLVPVGADVVQLWFVWIVTSSCPVTNSVSMGAATSNFAKTSW